LKELLADSLQISDNLFKQGFFQKIEENPNVLTIEAGTFSIIPIPGKTRINGRNTPTALETIFRNRVSIIPLTRYERSFLTEMTLEHNAIKFFGSFIAAPLYTIQKINQGVIPQSGRRYISLEAKQEIDSLNFQGIFVDRFQANFLFIVVQGELHDFLISISYASEIEGHPEISCLSEEGKLLAEIASSLKPLQIPNLEMLKKQQEEAATQSFDIFVENQGKIIFNIEWTLLIARLSSLNLSDNEQRLYAIRLLKPFIVLANELKIEDPVLKIIADSIDQADRGNADNLKEVIDWQIQIYRSASQSITSSPTQQPKLE
jgi:hypothetical protein